MTKRLLVAVAVVGLAAAACGGAHIVPPGAGAEGTSAPKKVEAYLFHVLSRLKQADAHGAGGALSVRLEIDPSVEAMAHPRVGGSAGDISITTGFLKTLESEAELAAVLAHEYAHLREGHGLPRAAGEGEIPFGEAMSRGGVKLAWDRKVIRAADEQEADRVALDLLARAGYRPEALLAVVERLVVLGEIAPEPRRTILRSRLGGRDGSAPDSLAESRDSYAANVLAPLKTMTPVRTAE
ncbi:MAG: M48 family metalloprotease [Nitrospirae bacterium]|nr:M48 family metalloprotease [Nitrospirota bacterium]